MACVTTNSKILIRRDTSTNWSTVNPLLLNGEQGYETNTGKMKIGDGIHNWNDLSYFSSGSLGPTGPTGPTGATGPQGPVSAYGFDGGYPNTVYASGPIFDLGFVS